MKEIYADLHIHSCFSDGTMTPREILDAAKARGLSFIAIADHYVLEGSRQLLAMCRDEGMGCVSAVELDSLDGERNIHVLGYNVNLDDEVFIRFVMRNRTLLDEISDILIGKMSVDYPELTSADYTAFSYDLRGGGWKALHYLLSKGLTQSLLGGLKYYGIYDCPYSIVNFPPVEEACAAIHLASGRAVLAHPREVLDTSDLGRFEAELNRFAGMGLDGIECYYPTHTEEVTQACLAVCKAHGLLVTCGSDCHGGFGKTSVGEMKIPIESLNLNF